MMPHDAADDIRPVGATAAQALADERPAAEQLRRVSAAGEHAGESSRTRIAVAEDKAALDSFKATTATLESALKQVAGTTDAGGSPAERDARMWLMENARLVHASAQQVTQSLGHLGRMPVALDEAASPMPRVLALGQDYCQASDDTWNLDLFAAFIHGFQKHTPLLLKETWTLPVGVQMSLLRRLAPAAEAVARNVSSAKQAAQVSRIMRSLLAMSVAVWPRVLEPLIAFEPVLRRDPLYARMDDETRDRYRGIVAHLARRADQNETGIAQMALDLATQQPPITPMTDVRFHNRLSHIGYYLAAGGRTELELKAGYHPTRSERLTRLVRRHAEDFYIGGVQLLALFIIALLMVHLVSYSGAMVGLMLAFLFSVLPASQGAVEILNHVVAALFPAEALPKLDFSAGVPAEHATLVAVPVLLISEAQVRELVNDLEVRFLANADPNLHYALLTDLPDSLEPPSNRDSNPLVELAQTLIEEAEARHKDGVGGGFLLLHRHRVFNAREGAWIGWERKRGKLLDLNQLLRGTHDSFPVKAGRLSVLPQIRYVLTLDADTQLPRDAAHRLVGTMAHPLNRAVIDPKLRIVTEGYGILQPRVGISIHSASRSRLASLYSGETGLDIYSRAASDTYQDLFGEAIFTGKGLYEVDVLQEVLLHRFPRNALLSHDLIEGSYARAGLVSDIEVIDDYPSHLSAWSRRKHRWVRGDWQVAQWLLPRVPDENNRKVDNPTSVISRWKIFDNLRRSLYEPAILLLFLAGWFGLPGGPFYWTFCASLLIFFPVFVQLGASLFRAAVDPVPGAVVDAMEGFYKGLATLALQVAFLPQQALLSLDAIVRTLFRRFVTGKRLLEWETAAQAEMGAGKRNPVDTYFNITPLLCLVTALLLLWLQRYALPFAVPFLLVWALGRPLTAWLNRAPPDTRRIISAAETRMLRQLALKTWRYFAHFSTEENHWLVPDNVEEEGMQVAARVSPTNIGLLLNARQAALAFGYLTLPEFVRLTSQTLTTLEKMEKHRGHLLNWYETDNLTPLTPKVISSVDNGNLLASLWTLRQHCLELLDKPIVHPALADGLEDYAAESGSTGLRLPPPGVVAVPSSQWEERMYATINAAFRALDEQAAPAAAGWAAQEMHARFAAVADLVRSYRPFLCEEYAPLRNMLALRVVLPITPRELPDYNTRMRYLLEPVIASGSPQYATLAETLRMQLVGATESARVLITGLQELAARAEKLACDMDFSMLLNPARGLLSIAYNVDEQRLEDACYDLLASEARTACFLAIAKEDIPQSSWFRLGRTHVFAGSSTLLTSWTGTMFEYLMPALWMHSFRGSMLARTEEAVIQVQQQHVRAERVPWGISESGCASRNASGHYDYHAFGLKEIAASPNATDGGPVIAPYAACLALPHAPGAAVDNISRMIRMGWLSDFGLYEAADYGADPEPDGVDRVRTFRHRAMPSARLVRSWMAHHQGMSLLALCNTLVNDTVRCWFRADLRVQATELLLHERPMRTSTLAAARAAKTG